MDKIRKINCFSTVAVINWAWKESESGYDKTRAVYEPYPAFYRK